MHDFTPIRSSIVAAAAARRAAPPASLGSVYDPRCCIAALLRSTFKSTHAGRTPRIYPFQLTDANVCACMLFGCFLPGKPPKFKKIKASLLKPGLLLASTRRLKRIGGWHETRRVFAPREVILACPPHPSERKANPPAGVVRWSEQKAPEAWRRGSGTRRPCHRRGVLRSLRLQSALLPLCRGRPLA